MAIADYLRKLVELKNQLVANLNSMGVVADESEKLNTLVPKVLECETEQDVTWSDNGGYPYFSLENNMKSIIIPKGFTIINIYAFSGFGNLESVIIPDGVQAIRYNAFKNCSNLSSITIPDSVTVIEKEVFMYDTMLADIYYTGTEEQWNAITKGDNWKLQMGLSVSGGTKIHYNYVLEGGE